MIILVSTDGPNVTDLEGLQTPTSVFCREEDIAAGLFELNRNLSRIEVVLACGELISGKFCIKQ